ncbi:MAG: hypothetical protein LBK18_06985 [Prevotellaceae bacterium]|jgi:hypothetical protein|nr:hypothetical protein [Prevotellaceae bacterium]
MNSLTFDVQKAELARSILNETDEKISKELSEKKVTFNSIALDTRNYKFSRDEANAR